MLFFAECDDYCQQAAQQARNAAVDAEFHGLAIFMLIMVMLMVGGGLICYGLDHVNHYFWESDQEYATKKRNAKIALIVGICLVIPPVLKLLIFLLLD